MAKRENGNPAGRAMSAQEPDRSTPTNQSMGLSFMPRHRATVVQGHVRATPTIELPRCDVQADLADACRRGRELIATRRPEPTDPRPSTCRLERGRPQQAYPVQAGAYTDNI